MEFKFYQDVKVSVWERSSFTITANSEEEAMKIAKKYAKEDVTNAYDDSVSVHENEILYDTEEVISAVDNNGSATIELYDSAKNLIGNNRIVE